jgi:phage terminase small subunit
MAKTTDSHRTLAEDKADKKVAGDKKRGKQPKSSRQERYREFAKAFLNAADSVTYLNCYQSALRAGYSPAYALGDSYKLLEKPGIKREIDAIKAAVAENPDIATADEVLKHLTMQLRVLPNKLFDPETKEHINPGEMTDAQSQALAGYKITQRIIPGQGEDGKSEIEIKYDFKLIDRQKAAEMLGRWHGIWEKDNKQRVPTTPQALVAFPTGILSLEDWQAAAIKILDANEKAKACGDAGNKSQPG